MKSIYSYTDYRQFLRDHYTFLKATERRFSHRIMATRLGFTAPNFLKLVMDGERNIGRSSVEKIAAGLQLNRKESEYFSYLVFFAQAKDQIEKNYYYGLITAIRARSSSSTVQAEQFEYFNKWYHPAVRELLTLKSDPLNYAQLSRRLGGAVSSSAIKRSVAMLLRLGLVQRDDAGIYRQSAPLLNTENELNSFAIRRYHEQVLGIACKAIHSVPAPEREIASVTLHISGAGFQRIKKRLQDFRQELLQIAGDDADPQEVYHMNLQLYPLTGPVPDETTK